MSALFTARAPWRRLLAAWPLLGILLGSPLALAADAAAAPTPAAQALESGFDLSRPDIAAFIEQGVRTDGWSRSALLATLRQARARPELLVTMAHAPEITLPWWRYRQRFVTPERIVMGVQFWLGHKELLDQVADASGVPPEYLVAILGVETRYGLTTGSYREIDTLMTLAFDSPDRARYFREELRQYLLLTREQHLDPVSTQGSYGGALGALQFMPSSYRRYARGAADSGPIDLWGDWAAILTSEANFLQQQGWQRGEPVLLDATLASGSELTASGGVRLTDTLGSLRARGVNVTSELPDGTAAVLIAAAGANGIQYQVGLVNFYVLTRYNPRINYALAVYDLAQRLRKVIVPAPATR